MIDFPRPRSDEQPIDPRYRWHQARRLLHNLGNMQRDQPLEGCDCTPTYINPECKFTK